jgi:hypothetical protein
MNDTRGHQKVFKAPSFHFEPYFTLTQDCPTGIIKAWHYFNLAGAKA